MKTLLVVGSTLIAVGVMSFAYFASPVRILLQGCLGQQKLHLLIPALGGAALLSGVAILFAIRPKVTSDKK